MTGILKRWRLRHRQNGARAALEALAQRCDRDAAAYRQKCRDSRAEFYADIASHIRNYTDWAVERVTRS